jgi:hypothetical protein
MTPTPMPLPTCRERSYLSAFEIAAIYIISAPSSGPILVSAVRDLVEAPPSWRRHGGRVISARRLSPEAQEAHAGVGPSAMVVPLRGHNGGGA